MGNLSGSNVVTARLGLGGHLTALTREPLMLWEAVRAGFAMRRMGRLLPSSAYLDWRTHTAYGDSKASIPSTDMVHYLHWRREMRMMSRWGRVR
ncbi:MAG: hypothetical protein O6923_08900 [Actinobacteria bacterium]|nr:hypothetical protein [Actinomycetota bacterium]